MPGDKGTHQGKLCSWNLDEAFCILKVTGVLIEKTLMYIIFSKILEEQPCRDPESYVRGGPTLTFFLVDEGREDQNTTKGGPSSARQRNTFHWRADNGPTLNAGLEACDFLGDLDQYCLETLFL